MINKSALGIMFMIKTFEKISTDKDIKKSYHKELRHECLKAIEAIRKISLNVKEGSDTDINAEDFFLPFQLACNSMSSKIIITALDGIQKLVAYGHLIGDREDEMFNIHGLGFEKNSENDDHDKIFNLLCPSPQLQYLNNKMIDRIVKVVCECANSEYVTEDVYLQIIKALLTIVSSTQCQVHETSLLLAIRTCYNIHLLSKNLVIQTTAKATLNQMVSLIFNRMEAHDPNYCNKHCGLLGKLNQTVEQDNNPNNDDLRSFIEDELDNTVMEVMNDIVNRIEYSENTIKDIEDNHPSGSINKLTSAATLNDSFSENLPNVTTRVTEDGGPSRLSDTTVEAYKCKIAYTLRRDAFLVFRSLCRLALKDVNAPPVLLGNEQQQSQAYYLNSKHYKQQLHLHRQNMINSKIMSLQLLHSIIENAGPVFKTQESAFKFGVCYHVMAAFLPKFPIINSPLQGGNGTTTTLRSPFKPPPEDTTMTNKNNNINVIINLNDVSKGASNHPTSKGNEEIFEDLKLFEICVHLFTSILEIFRKHLKLQIEVFFKEIYLNVLENPFPNDYKLIVLNSLSTFCSNPQDIIDLYVNYDCDLTATNLFARLVTALSRIVCCCNPLERLASNTMSSYSSNLSSPVSSFTHFNPMNITTFINNNNSQPEDNNNWETINNEHSPLRTKGLVCLVAIGRCMTQWCMESSNRMNDYLDHHDFLDQSRQRSSRFIGGGMGVATEDTRINLIGSCFDSPLDVGKEFSRKVAVTLNNNRDDSYKDIVTHYHQKIRLDENSSPNDFSSTLYGLKDEQTSTVGGGPTMADIKFLRGGDLPYIYENLKHIKEIIERGIEMFKKNPGKGIHYLQNNTNLVGTAARDIAKFLFSETRLDKIAVGNYLGENDEFNKDVMYAYIDLMNFNGKEFVQALRYFLERFKLPGEAQKVDRLMQKFASRYVETTNYGNGIFQSADSAYVLAFSIIMLTTDLHNPQVKKKMTKPEYIRINKSTSDQKDLPETYLSKVYDEIAENKFAVKDNVIDEEDMGKDLKNNELKSAVHMEHVRPMFKISWTPMLAAYSVCLQDSENVEVISLCLDGMKYAVKIACIFQLELERNAFVQAISHFTFQNVPTSIGGSVGLVGNSATGTFSNTHSISRNLNYAGAFKRTHPQQHQFLPTSATTASGVSEGSVDFKLQQHHDKSSYGPKLITLKNLMTINTFISIAETEGNYLGTSWFDFLKCVSQLELAKIVVAPSLLDETLNFSACSTTGTTTTADTNNFPESSTTIYEETPATAAMRRASSSVNYDDLNQFTTISKDFSNINPSLSDTITNDETASIVSSNSYVSSTLKSTSTAPATIIANHHHVTSLTSTDSAKQNLLVRVDKIFSNSINLDGEAICDFVRALCKVSSDELQSATHNLNVQLMMMMKFPEKIEKRTKTGASKFRPSNLKYYGTGQRKAGKDNFSSSNPHNSVTREFFGGSGGVRLYSLQKIVEISYYNMSRIRLQWSKIWDILGPHFNQVGCHPNESVAFFALDSLRQLSTKFLEKGELSNFRFQKDFLKPFEYIIKHNKSLSVSDMTVRCIDQMIRAQAHNIKSGWKNIFNVFQIVATSIHDLHVYEMAFNSLNYITTEISENERCDFVHNLVDSFQNLVKCLSEFACYESNRDTIFQKDSVVNMISTPPTNPILNNNKLQKPCNKSPATSTKTIPASMGAANTVNEPFPCIDISMDAIKLIRLCAQFVYTHPSAFKEFTYEELNVSEDDYPWVKGWFPVLFELSCVINRCSLDIRTRALTVMFDILKSYGHEFSPHWWKDFFRVLFRIFDNYKIPNAKSEKFEWMNTTCNHALYAIVDVFSQFYDPLCTTLLQDFYQQLKWCLKQGNEQLARAALNCLENVITCNGMKFGVREWDHSCNIVVQIFCETLPNELFDQSLWTDQQPSSANDSSALVEHSSGTRSRENSIIVAASEDSTGEFQLLPETSTPVAFTSTTSLYHKITVQCVIQLELIRCMDRLLFYKFPEELLTKKTLPSSSRNSTGDHYNHQSGGPPFYNLKLNNHNNSTHRNNNSVNNNNNARTRVTDKNNDLQQKETPVSMTSEASNNPGGYKYPTPSAAQYTNYNYHQHHHQVLSDTKRILFYECLTSRQILHLAMDFLLKSHRFAQKFNTDMKLRETLHHRISFKGNAKPNLIKQETSSLELFLNILFTMYEDDSKQNQCQFVKDKLTLHLIESLKYFVNLESKSHKEAWNALIRLILTKLLVLKESKFRLILMPVYPYCCELITKSFEIETRSLLRMLFLKIGSSIYTNSLGMPKIVNSSIPLANLQLLSDSNSSTGISQFTGDIENRIKALELDSDLNNPTRLI